MLLEGRKRGPSPFSFNVFGTPEPWKPIFPHPPPLPRVPLEDGKRYAWALRARADPPPPPVRVLVFPEDTHALDRPQTEFEQFINAAWWLKQHM